MITVLQRRPLLALPSPSASPEPSPGPALAEATGVSSGQTQSRILFLILHWNEDHAAYRWFQGRVKYIYIVCVEAPNKWGLCWILEQNYSYFLYNCLRIKINIHLGFWFWIRFRLKIFSLFSCGYTCEDSLQIVIAKWLLAVWGLAYINIIRKNFIYTVPFKLQSIEKYRK